MLLRKLRAIVLWLIATRRNGLVLVLVPLVCYWRKMRAGVRRWILIGVVMTSVGTSEIVSPPSPLSTVLTGISSSTSVTIATGWWIPLGGGGVWRSVDRRGWWRRRREVPGRIRHDC
jgi:hypothetical protein